VFELTLLFHSAPHPGTVIWRVKAGVRGARGKSLPRPLRRGEREGQQRKQPREGGMKKFKVYPDSYRDKVEEVQLVTVSSPAE